MPLYRITYVRRDQAEVIPGPEFEADTDLEAILLADDRRTLSAMELWCGERLVQRWDSFPPI